jgi:transposase
LDIDGVSVHAGKRRKFIKGQKYTPVSHMRNMRGTARRNLKLLLSANRRFNTA